MAGTAPADVVHSLMDVPSFANSAMDGFALRAADSANASAEHPVTLAVHATVAAGQEPADGLAGHAAEIMTGAPVPRGYDTVIPVERVDAERNPDGTAVRIRLIEPVPVDRHIRRAGEDFTLGESILDNGRLIEPHHLMGLAATGIDQLDALPRPKVALLTTGSELAPTGIPAGGGMIRDSNGPYLRSFFSRVGLELVDSRSVADNARDLHAAIEACSESADIVMTTGGVSAGRFDLVPAAIEALGGDIVFHRVAMRPGKPLLFARLANGRVFFGLPGNPIAVAVGVRFFVMAAVAHLQGLAPERWLPSRCASPVGTRENLTFFGKAQATVDADGQLHTRLLPGQESFKIHSLMRANCWAIVPEGTADVTVGERIDIAPLYPDSFLNDGNAD